MIERDWFDAPDTTAIADDRRLYAVVANERTASALRRLLRIEAAARAICDPMIQDAGGDRWWDAHVALRIALDEGP